MSTILDTSNDGFRTLNDEMRQQIRQQIGLNILPISGGQVIKRPTGITLPVSSGYDVTVDLDSNDTYVVRRVLRRGSKVFLKGERTNVYAEEVSEAAYYASCFRSYDETEWPEKR